MCSVAHFTPSAAVLGNPAIQSEHQGVTWRFANAENQAIFLRGHTKYTPHFGGCCANGTHCAVDWGASGGPNTWRMCRGKLCVWF